MLRKVCVICGARYEVGRRQNRSKTCSRPCWAAHERAKKRALRAPEVAARNARREAEASALDGCPRARLGARIRAARLRARLTIRAAAQALGVTPRTLMSWEGGRQAPRAERAECIARVLKAPGLVARCAVPYGVAAKRDALEGPRDGSLSFAQLLRLERCRLGWRQEDLAQRSGLSRSTIGHYEAGTKQPKHEGFVRWLEDALGCDLVGAYRRTRNEAAQREASAATNRAMWAAYQERRAAGAVVTCGEWPAIWRAEQSQRRAA